MVFISENLNIRLFVGRNVSHLKKKLNETLSSHLKQHFDFLITPLFESTISHHAYPDTELEPTHWRYIVGEVIGGFSFDNLDEEKRKFSKKLLKQEINYAIYLGVHAMIIPFPEINHSNYVRIINKLLEKAVPNTEIWIHIPLKEKNCWEIYNSFRMNIKKTNCFGVLLEISEDLPDSLDRWFGENIRAVSLSVDLFVLNQKNKPVLIKSHQELISKLIFFKLNFIIKSPNNEDLTEYRNYLCYIFSKQPKMSELQKIEASYYDKLQIPLQPSKDNLEMYTYLAFEKDKIKYEIYAKALHEILLKKFTADQKILIIMVGPGRGPIMREIIKACQDLGFENFELKAIEKNENSIPTLQSYIKENEESLKGRVKIIHEDIRNVVLDEKADILVSEMLGSFGDNELSPELVVSAERLLKKDGYSLPCQYTSYITPITCAHSYNKVCSIKSLEKPLEIAHLIAFQRYNLPSKIFSCFRFEHPFKDQSNFKRFKVFEFDFKEQNLIHGLAGYFDCFLFEEIFYSICPLNKTKNMFSWFPIFFPFETPLIVDEHKILRIFFWRLGSKKKVWYEWQPEVICQKTKNLIVQLKIHNSNGKYYSIEK